MADLGTIGVTYPARRVLAAFDIVWARDVSQNPVRCYGRGIIDNYMQGLYPDQEKRIAGFVRNAAGTGIARTVLAIDSRTGALRARTVSASDGSFSVKIQASLEPVLVIAVPDPGDVKNVVAFSGVLPV